MSYQCKKCGSEVPEDALFCSKCGEKVTALRCPNCGKRLPEDSAFCTYCGAKIAAEQPKLSQPQIQQPSDTAKAAPKAVISSAEDQFSAEQQRTAAPQEITDQKSKSADASKEDVKFDVQQSANAKAEPDYTGDLSDVIIKNTQYYLPEFEKARRNEKCRFNWAAFFFNGIFAYYRKSQEVFWHYYKWPFIIYAVIVLGISGSGFLAFKSDTGLAAWMVAVTILSVAINIYLLVTNIRFGKNFNKEYYQHCMVQAESSEITPRTAGTSAKNAILYWIVMTICVGIISAIAGTLISAAVIGRASDGLWDDDTLSDEDYQEIIHLAQISGCWEVTGITVDGATYPIKNSRENGFCLIFHLDYTAELYYFENGTVDSVDAAWKWGDESVEVTVPGDGTASDTTTSFRVDGDYLILTTEDGATRFEKTSEDEQLPDYLQSDTTSQSTIALSDFVGDYSYDASFDNPDGTSANFCYSLQILQVLEGINASLEWRGNRIFNDIYIGDSTTIDGNTITFYVEDYQTDYEPGYHSLTYIPAAQSPYGSDTIYVDGDTEMPYLRDTYVSATSYVPSTDYSAPFSAFVGTWQDENDESAYLFVGYGDETEETAYAYAFVPTGDYQVQLIENGSTNAFGNFMRYGSEPEFSIDLTRESGWIDATVYYGATGVEKNFRFLPVDPNTCAYRNPYYIGGESANEPCANDYDFGSGNTVYDYALDSSSGYDFNHEPENWGDLINGFNALNENLENNFWDIVGAMN